MESIWTRQEVSARAGGEPAAADRTGRSEREDNGLACKDAGIVEQTYFCWRKEYGGLQVDQAKRLKEFGAGELKLKRLVANLSLNNLVKDFASGNF